MYLAALLGTCYLWCDRLYIVQDDECINNQIPRMGEIFALATCTIAVKGSGDADSGLCWMPWRLYAKLPKSDLEASFFR